VLRIAVVGAGWAGLAAAVQATALGHAVTLFEMAPQCGGRARGVDIGGLQLDNGQHIMIGAYTELLRLMNVVGADPQQLLLRTPLALVDAAGSGLHLGRGNPAAAFTTAVLRHPTWNSQAKLALIVTASRWALTGFRCDPGLSVSALTSRLPRVLGEELIDPLCVAALNTPSVDASASVFLRVMKDALFSGPGSSDLLIPRVHLGDVFPNPALTWLGRNGAAIRPSSRVHAIKPLRGLWAVDEAGFDRVVLATPPGEASRLVSPFAPDWAKAAQELRYEPIVTAYLSSPGTRLPAPMLVLHSNAAGPAQFVFDRGQLGGPGGLLAFVISGARRWVEFGTPATLEATLAQATSALSPVLRAPLAPIRLLTEKRATFRCTPRLQRPSFTVAAGLWAAGDYVDGPYPATLEGAVRSGIQAAVAASRH
jgi:hydroxysqualene dehydroxylase